MAMTLITTNTESGATTSDFTSGIDSTYKLYIFKIINWNPATDSTHTYMKASVNGGSSWGLTKTGNTWYSYSNESGGTPNVGGNLAASTQDTDPITILSESENDADSGGAAIVYLFNPSDTTYTTIWMSRGTGTTYVPSLSDYNTSGYFNTTTAVNGIQFYSSSGAFDAIIKMYGVK